MAGDLGAREEQVHAVLDFWFGLTKEQQFASDEQLDRQIASRFGYWSETLIATDAVGHHEDADALLAAIIGADQFPRNIHRGGAAAFAGDALAQHLTLHAIGRGWDTAMITARRVFLYMPLMHAEHAALQALSVEKFAALGLEENLAFARAHRDAIDRFGRFPAATRRWAACRRPRRSAGCSSTTAAGDPRAPAQAGARPEPRATRRSA